MSEEVKPEGAVPPNVPYAAYDKAAMAGRPPRPAGLGVRTLAFIVDVMLLGVVGFLLGLVASPQLIALGAWGRVLGFFIAMLYFVPPESALGGGRSVGKRLFGLRVVDKEGQAISLGRSLLRYAIVGIPWFLNNALLPAQLLMAWPAVLLSVVIFGMGLGVVYLYLFNRGTGQALQDLAAGSYVLAEGRSLPTAPVARMHGYILAVIFLLSVAAPLVIKSTLSSAFPFNQMLQAITTAQATGDVFTSRISKGVTYGKQTVRHVDFTVYLKQQPEQPDAEAGKFARIVIQAFGDTSDIDGISIVLVHGYDIGISSAWSSQVIRKRPGEWAQAMQ